MVNILQLSDEQIALPRKPAKSNKTALEYKLGWARTCLSKYGSVENAGRGVWALTAKGRAATEMDSQDVVRGVTNMSSAGKRLPVDEASSEIEIPPADALEAGNPLEEQNWREQLFAILKGMDPIAFERLCQRILRESVFTPVDVTRTTGDGGVDGIGLMRIGGLLSFRVLFQCKRYSGSVGASGSDSRWRA